MAHASTTTTTPTSDESVFRCHLLPDGRNVDLRTSTGADAFVRGMPQFLQVDMETTLDPIRARLVTGGTTQPNLRDTQRLIETYTTIGVVFDKMSLQVFAEMIAPDQTELWVTHISNILKQLTVDPRWILTGVLTRHDQKMLDCLTPIVKHYSMVQHMLSTKFFLVLANFVRARPAPQMPCATVTDTICAIAGNLQLCLQHHHQQEQQQQPGHAFRRFADCGLLAQTLRCLTVPPAITRYDVLSHRLSFLDNLIKQSVQMRRKFKPTSPTGTMLQAIVHGQDGHAQCPPAIRQRFQSLTHLLEYTARPLNIGTVTTQESCRYCSTNGRGMELLACSRCKSE